MQPEIQQGPAGDLVCSHRMPLVPMYAASVGKTTLSSEGALYAVAANLCT